MIVGEEGAPKALFLLPIPDARCPLLLLSGRIYQGIYIKIAGAFNIGIY